MAVDVARRRWTPESVARRQPTVSLVVAGCWRCGETQPGRLPGHGLTRNGVVIGIVPLCRSCVAEIPRLDPDPLTVVA